jgi:hypothetical protein
MAKHTAADFGASDNWREAEQLARVLVHLAAQYALNQVAAEIAAKRVHEGLSAIGSGDTRRMRRALMQAESVVTYD